MRQSRLLPQTRHSDIHEAIAAKRSALEVFTEDLDPDAYQQRRAWLAAVETQLKLR